MAQNQRFSAIIKPTTPSGVVGFVVFMVCDWYAKDYGPSQIVDEFPLSGSMIQSRSVPEIYCCVCPFKDLFCKNWETESITHTRMTISEEALKLFLNMISIIKKTAMVISMNAGRI